MLAVAVVNGQMTYFVDRASRACLLLGWGIGGGAKDSSRVLGLNNGVNE